jgi:hypothetical protein
VKGDSVPVSATFWRWLANAAGTLLVEVVIALLFGDSDDRTEEK